MNEIKKFLLVSPGFPTSYWSFKHARRFVGKKGGMPPLALATLAAMFPGDVQFRLVDADWQPLTDEDIDWADAVFVTAMAVQKPFVLEILRRIKARDMRKITVFGGPYATSYHDVLIQEGWPADCYFVGEAEGSCKVLYEKLQQGGIPRILEGMRTPDITRSPVPRFDLFDLSDYTNVAVQFSRGCPFTCKFCDIIKLYGNTARTKSTQQMLSELDLLYRLGWRGSVFFVDDNFIGNKRAVGELLTELATWQKARGYPFQFFTEASIDLARYDRLLEKMRDAGFYKVFLGIETPNPEALQETGKTQNISAKGETNFLLKQVRIIQSYGLEVMAGFIAGLDGDGPTSFDAIIAWVKAAGIPEAMTGLLAPYRGTELYEELRMANRLVGNGDGDNMGSMLTFIPKSMAAGELLAGYRRILNELYGHDLRNYYERCLTHFAHSCRASVFDHGHTDVRQLARDITAFLRSSSALWGRNYLRFLATVLHRFPKRFTEAAVLAAEGYHFQKVTQERCRALDEHLKKLAEANAFGVHAER